METNRIDVRRVAVWAVILFVVFFAGVTAGSHYMRPYKPPVPSEWMRRVDSLETYVTRQRAIIDSLEVAGQRIDTVIVTRYERIKQRHEFIDTNHVDSAIRILRDRYGATVR